MNPHTNTPAWKQILSHETKWLSSIAGSFATLQKTLLAGLRTLAVSLNASQEHIRREFGTRIENLLLAVVIGTLALSCSASNGAIIPTYLFWPTDPKARISTGFGDDWVAKGCDGLLKRHCAIDISVRKGRPVYAAEFGWVVMVGTDPTWKSWITVNHTDWQSRAYTTVYWHVNPQVKIGDQVSKGQRIGTVADMGLNSHLHFGIRNAPYSNIANRGALPRSKCKPSDDPKFPEFFVDPRKYTKP